MYAIITIHLCAANITSTQIVHGFELPVFGLSRFNYTDDPNVTRGD